MTDAEVPEHRDRRAGERTLLGNLHKHPSWRQRVEAERLRHDRRFGEAVASFRADRGLRQSDIARLSERHVRRIEDGLSMPRLETLRRLAKAHGLALGDYLDEVARRVVREQPGVRAAS